MTAPRRRAAPYSRPCRQPVPGGRCGATPTRLFVNGPRCQPHAPPAPPAPPRPLTPNGTTVPHPIQEPPAA